MESAQKKKGHLIPFINNKEALKRKNIEKPIIQGCRCSGVQPSSIPSEYLNLILSHYKSSSGQTRWFSTQEERKNTPKSAMTKMN
jgi:hypothetical protein